MSKAERSASNYRRKVQREMRAANREIRRAATVAKTLAGGFVAREVIRYADAWTTATNRLKLATDTQKELAQAQKAVFNISQKTRSDIGATAELYQRLSMNASKYIKGQQDLANITETVTKSIKLSGSGTAASQAAITQFSQALASGVLRGQEFNSVMEQAPRLAKAIADGMGVPVDQLRALAQDGQITADKLIDALRSQKDFIDNEYKNVIPTVADGWTNVSNSIQKAVGEINNISGASNVMISGLQSAAASIDGFTKNTEDLKTTIAFAKNAAIVLGSVMAGRLVGKLGLATRATTILASAETYLGRVFTVTQRKGVALATKMVVMNAKTKLLSRTVAILGGPVGAVGALATAASMMYMFGSSADATSKKVASLRGQIDLLSGSLQTMTKSQAQEKLFDLDKSIFDAKKNLQKLKRQIETINRERTDRKRTIRLFNDDGSEYTIETGNNTKALERLRSQRNLYLEMIRNATNLQKKVKDISINGNPAIKQNKVIAAAGSATGSEKAAKLTQKLNDDYLRLTLSAREYAIHQARQNGASEYQIALLKRNLDLEEKINAEKGKGAAIVNTALKAQQTEMKKLSGSGYLSKAMSFLRQVEGFSSKAYWDVNHYRTGYGSDTVTRADGSVHSVTKNTKTNRADAERDLARRLNQEFVPSVKRIIGTAIFNGLTEGQKVAMIGLRYRGDLRKGGSIAKAAQAGDMSGVVKAIERIAANVQDKGVKNRLMREARLFGGGGFSSDGFVQEQQAVAQQIKDTQDAFANLTGQLQTADEKRLATLKQQLEIISNMQLLKDAGSANVSQNSIDDARKRAIGAALSAKDAPTYQGGVQNPIGGILGEYDKIDKQRELLTAWHQEKLTLAQEALNKGLIQEQEYADNVLAIQQQLNNQHQSLEQSYNQVAIAAGGQLFGELAGMAKTYAGEQSGIYKAMFAMQKAFAIASAMINIQKAVSEAGTLPFPANLPAMATVAANMGSIVSNIMAISMPSGMAHDGIDSVPNDGTWLLQKGERVMTAKTSAKLDNTLSNLQRNQKINNSNVVINLIEDAGRAGQTSERNDNGANVIDVFVSNIMSDGKASKALTQTFGLKRQGI